MKDKLGNEVAQNVHNNMYWAITERGPEYDRKLRHLHKMQMTCPKCGHESRWEQDIRGWSTIRPQKCHKCNAKLTGRKLKWEDLFDD